MGGNGPSRFSEKEKEEESGGLSLVEGIRLSDRVINRMKHSSKVACPHMSPKPQTPAAVPVPPPPVEHLLPLLTPPPAPLEAKPSPPSSPVTPIAPPPVMFQSLPPNSVEPGETNTPPPTAPPVVETLTKSEPPPSPPGLKTEALTEPVVLAPPVEAYASSPSPVDACRLSPQLEPASPPAETPAAPSAALEEVPPVEAPAAGVVPPPAAPEPDAAPSRDPSLVETSSACQCEVLSVIPTESLADAPSSEPEAPPPPPPRDPVPPTEEFTMTTSLPPFLEEESPMTTASVTAGEALSVTPEVTEEALRQEIRAELQKRLDEEMAQKRQELRRQLDQLKSQADAEAGAAARTRVEQQVKETLEAEKGAHLEKLTESIARERAKTDDERLLVQLYWMELKAHQLQQKEKDLKKREALYREQVAKIEARCAEFYRVSGESFKKAKEETHDRFARFNIQPVCGDLQGQILKCYKENAGKTLICSGIASAYMQCVDNAKKNKLTPGG